MPRSYILALDQPPSRATGEYLKQQHWKELTSTLYRITVADNLVDALLVRTAARMPIDMQDWALLIGPNNGDPIDLVELRELRGVE